MTEQGKRLSAADRLAAIDAFLCEHGLLKAENPDEDDALFLTPGGYWEARECDDVGDHVDAIKKLVEWSREGGYYDGLAVAEGAREEVLRLHQKLCQIHDYAKTASRTSRGFARVACDRLYHVAGDAAQALNESKERMGERRV
jgi:hypothetical protein